MLRRAPALVSVVTAALALTACGGDEPDSVAVPSGIPTPTVSESAAAVASAVASDKAQQTLAITVSQGKATGDTGRQQVALGTRLRITVTADVADEVHVHVYDLKQQLSVNQPGFVEFVADKPGVIDVELEGAGLTLTRLVIS